MPVVLAGSPTGRPYFDKRQQFSIALTGDEITCRKRFTESFDASLPGPAGNAHFVKLGFAGSNITRRQIGIGRADVSALPASDAGALSPPESPPQAASAIISTKSRVPIQIIERFINMSPRFFC